MYTNPFSRTHSHVRQVIDRFLNVDGLRRSKKRSGMSRHESANSVCSSSSTSSNWSNSSSHSIKSSYSIGEKRSMVK